jgi:hypothetical protein
MLQVEQDSDMGTVQTLGRGGGGGAGGAYREMRKKTWYEYVPDYHL